MEWCTEDFFRRSHGLLSDDHNMRRRLDHLMVTAVCRHVNSYLSDIRNLCENLIPENFVVTNERAKHISELTKEQIQWISEMPDMTEERFERMTQMHGIDRTFSVVVTISQMPGFYSNEIVTSSNITFEAHVMLLERYLHGLDEYSVQVDLVRRVSTVNHEKCAVPLHLKEYCVCR